MKIQSLAVIFAIIILPIIIVLSYYIHRQVDTIALETSYNTKLIDATHDAMAAFELNTANEDLSGVSDALRSIIVASKNIFFNTLATNLGMSNANESYIQSFVPAMLYTLYDGYYIYAPTRVPEVLTARPQSDVYQDEQVVFVGDRGVNRGTDDTVQGSSTKVHQYTFDASKYNGQKLEPVDLSSWGDTKYDYGRMLYKNKDGTYSTQIYISNDPNKGTYFKQDYILKSYMPYSARYLQKPDDPAHSSWDLTINYTLDNYLTVMGSINNVYYSKTGYLIADKTVEKAFADDDDLLTYNEIDAEEICLSGKHSLHMEIKPFLENGESRVDTSIVYDYSPYEELDSITGQIDRLTYIQQKDRLTKCYENIETYYNNYRNAETDTDKSEALNQIIAENEKVKILEESVETLAAITYYVKAQVFSNWVYANLGAGGVAEIRESNIKDELADLNNENYTSDFSSGDDEKAFHHSFEGSNILIFDTSKNPENLSSPFVTHKFDVIKNSIQYNLNLCLSVYDVIASQMDIKMPVLSEEEWEKILQNISIVTFMQGFNCGLKIYNNYAIVSSTNNELTVIPSEVYYVKKEEYNSEDYPESMRSASGLTNNSFLYHRIDCPELEDTLDLISFRSKEVKYDKIYEKNSAKYKYDHKNLACYNCIVGSNYLKRLSDYKASEVIGYSDDILVSSLSLEKKKAYYRGIAKARQLIYKTNALTDSSGYETIFNSTNNETEINWSNLRNHCGTSGDRNVSEIKEIQVTVRDVNSSSSDVTTATFRAYVNGHEVNEDFVFKFQETPQTISIPVHFEDNNKLSSLSFNKVSPVEEVSAHILNIRLIYE